MAWDRSLTLPMSFVGGAILIGTTSIVMFFRARDPMILLAGMVIATAALFAGIMLALVRRQARERDDPRLAEKRNRSMLMPMTLVAAALLIGGLAVVMFYQTWDPMMLVFGMNFGVGALVVGIILALVRRRAAARTA